jgi:HAD superfamily hydrolase (TIGR01459 family)
MTSPIHLPSLAALADSYDAIFCDIWGVLHDGVHVDQAAVAALSDCRARGITVILLSNVPKPNAPIYGQLDRLGASRTAYDAIVTSGDAIRVELAARSPGPMYRIGPPEFDADLWQGLNLAEAPLDQAAFVAVSGLDHPAREHPDDYLPRLATAKARNLELLCANPDRVVRVGKDLIWCAGALADRYTAMGGRVVMAGKPCPPIYAMARQALSDLRGAPVPDHRILAIGDGPATDVQGANAEGLDCLFVASGINDAALSAGGTLDLEKVNALLLAQGLRAKFASRSLA